MLCWYLKFGRLRNITRINIVVDIKVSLENDIFNNLKWQFIEPRVPKVSQHSPRWSSAILRDASVQGDLPEFHRLHM
jgi:hypothetical protein